MKNEFYARSLVALLILTCGLGPGLQAQCLCSGGVPATPVTYYSIIDTTDAPSTTISFPKFDPSIGTLSCIYFNDTLSGVSTTGVRNLASFDATYKFLLNISNDISGPGINVNESFSKNYGPTLLTAYGTPGDTTTYGPDTIFNHSAHVSNTSNASPYLGSSGTVDFVYTLNGGLLSTQGGVNYSNKIRTRYWGAFRLTYYWCPNAVLANGLKHFNIAGNNKNFVLTWDVYNEDPGNKYTVEYSRDGHSFTALGSMAAQNSNTSYAKYRFPYSAGRQEEGYYSFRIKQVSPAGLVLYSPVRSVLLEEENEISYQTAPNPAGKSVNISFYKPVSGNYQIELVNMSGQILYQHQYRLINQYNINVEWTAPIPKGLYFLRVKDQQQALQKMTKLLLN